MEKKKAGKLKRIVHIPLSLPGLSKIYRKLRKNQLVPDLASGESG